MSKLTNKQKRQIGDELTSRIEELAEFWGEHIKDIEYNSDVEGFLYSIIKRIPNNRYKNK